MILLTLEQLLEIHAIVIDATGGGMGLRDLGRLEAAVATQTQNVFGEELYSSIFDKSAAVVRSIIGDHPFIDGNKRTAMLAGLTLLRINSCVFEFREGEIEDFAVKIAVEQSDVSVISAWLEQHSTSS